MKSEEIWRSCKTCLDCHHDSALYEHRCATCLGKERDAAYAVLKELVKGADEDESERTLLAFNLIHKEVAEAARELLAKRKK